MNYMHKFKYLLRKFLFSNTLDDSAMSQMDVDAEQIEYIKLRRCEIIKFVTDYQSVIEPRIERQCRRGIPILKQVFELCSLYY